MIMESGNPLVVCDIQQDERFSRKDFYGQQGMVSYLGMPLISRGEIIGVLSLFTNEKHQVTNEEMAFVETLADHASIIIHNSQLYEQIRSKSQNLLDSEQQIRALASDLICAQDEEAKRIARVLHDESGQLLAAVYITMDQIAKRLPASATAQVEKVKKLLDRVENREARDLEAPEVDAPARQLAARQLALTLEALGRHPRHTRYLHGSGHDRTQIHALPERETVGVKESGAAIRSLATRENIEQRRFDCAA